MKHVTGLYGLVLSLMAACQQQEPAVAPLPPPPPAEPPAAASPVPAAPPAELPAPPPATADERAKWLKNCWALFNAKDFAQFQTCYAEDATSEQVDLGMPPLVGRANIIERNARVFASAFPDLTGEIELMLVSGSDVLSVVLLRGTHQGALPGPQGAISATNKKIGYLVLQHVQTTVDGRSVGRERFIYDGGTFMSQVGVSPVPGRKVLEQGWADRPLLVSSGSEAERANLATLAAWTLAVNQHEVSALAALMTDDVVFADLSAPADRVSKKEVLKAHDDMRKAFPDLKVDQSAAWAAGDYVVSAGRFTGTSTGDAPSMKLRKTGKSVNLEYYMVTKLEGGKVKNNWLFSNGLAFAGQLGLLPPAKPRASGASSAQSAGGLGPEVAAPSTAGSATKPKAK